MGLVKMDQDVMMRKNLYLAFSDYHMVLFHLVHLSFKRRQNCHSDSDIKLFFLLANKLTEQLSAKNILDLKRGMMSTLFSEYSLEHSMQGVLSHHSRHKNNTKT